MKQHGTGSRRKRGEHGQVLILAIVALILVILAILLLFDVQTVIRGKIKGQNAADAAALTGAEWQRHSLNLIGELNLVRAAGTLISDPFFESAVLDPKTYEGASEFFFPSGNKDRAIRNQTDDYLSFPDLRDLVKRDENGEITGVDATFLPRLAQAIDRVERERFYLDTLDRIVSQLQTRISFVGPLIGFGAAQQAAKKNGISSDPYSNEFFVRYANLVRGNESDIYSRYVPQKINDYFWRGPYYNMLASVNDSGYGIAAGTRFQFTAMPTLAADPPSDLTSLLGNKSFYEAILGRNWCVLDQFLEWNFNGSWWSSFQCDYESSFASQSEILPLHVTFSYFSPEDSTLREPYNKPTDVFYNAADSMEQYIRDRKGELLSRRFRDNVNFYNHGYRHTYEVLSSSSEEKEKTKVTVANSPFSPFPDQQPADDEPLTGLDKINTWDFSDFTPEDFKLFIETVLSSYNDGDSDRLYTPIPILSWAIFDHKWNPIREETKELWEREYLNGEFKEGMDYHSGAFSFFETQQETVTISGSMGRPMSSYQATENEGQNNGNGQDIGMVFSNTGAGAEAIGVSHGLSNLRNNVDRIRTTASARPIGSIKSDKGTVRPFDAGRMVLPVFTKTVLMPISLDQPEGISMLDLDWYFYLTEFVPLLSGCPSLEEARNRAMSQYRNHWHYFQKYYNALGLISDPGFRQRGIDWLNTVVVWEKDERGNRYPVKTNRDVHCRSGGGESTPPVLH